MDGVDTGQWPGHIRRQFHIKVTFARAMFRYSTQRNKATSCSTDWKLYISPALRSYWRNLEVMDPIWGDDW